MFQTIQTFSVNGKFTEHYHIFCARIDLFTIFVCSHYRLWVWATVRLLHHFGFVMCVKSRLYCMHFSYHWRKICNVSRQLTQISKMQRDPWICLNAVLEWICCLPITVWTKLHYQHYLFPINHIHNPVRTWSIVHVLYRATCHLAAVCLDCTWL